MDSAVHSRVLAVLRDLFDQVTGLLVLHFEDDVRLREDAERNAEAAEFVEALLFHRYTAKLGYELEFWRSFPDLGAMAGRYAERLLTATGFRYPPDNYLADMDWGFYSADYLRAWIRAAQLRHRLRGDVGEGWWRSPDTGDFLRELFREGTRPSSEEIAARLGFDPLDTGPLVSELTGPGSEDA